MQLLFILYYLYYLHVPALHHDLESSYFISTIGQLSETKDDISMFLSALLFVVIQGRATVYRGYFTSCEQCRTIIDVSTHLCISVYDLRVKTFNLVLMTPYCSSLY